MMGWFDDGYGPGHVGMGTWDWIAMLAGLLLVLAVVVTAAVLLVRMSRPASRPPAGPAAGRPTAEQVLAERFARGDIDEREYRDRLAALAEAAGSSPPRS